MVVDCNIPKKFDIFCVTLTEFPHWKWYLLRFFLQYGGRDGRDGWIRWSLWEIQCGFVLEKWREIGKKMCFMQMFHEHLKLKMGIPVVYSGNIYRLSEDNIQVWIFNGGCDLLCCMLVMKTLELFFNFAVDQDQDQYQTFIQRFIWVSIAHTRCFLTWM